MRKRNTSGPNEGGRKRSSSRSDRSSGRGGARSNDSRSSRSSFSKKDKPSGRSLDDREERPSRGKSGFSSSRSESSRGFSKKPSFGRSREEGDERPSRGKSGFSSSRSEGSSRGFSKKPSFGRSRNEGDERPSRGKSGFSSRGEDAPRGFSKKSSFGRSRNEGDEKPSRKSGFSNREDSKRSFGKGSKSSFGKERGDREERSSRRKSDFSDRDDTRSASRKSFDRAEGGEFKRPIRRSDERPERGDRSERTSGKKGFFSKLSRGGKSFDRKHDVDFGKSVKSFKEHKEESGETASGKIRLNKYIANSGVCSRREADELITMGLVTVNGTTITELGYKINPGDVVKYDGKTLRAEKPVYILLNKPKGYITTTTDPQERNTVMHIIGDAVKERIYPVGRLDRNTTGLLLLTNDGELTDKLSHPSYNVKKIYKVELDKPLAKTDFQKIIDGVQLEEGRAMVDDLAIVSPDGKTVGIELHIGWNRVVRRIFERLEYTVVKLDRTIYAGLDKKDLPRGHWRFLTNEEIVRLKHFK